VGAFLPSAGIAVYGASKAFLNFFSLALQAELEGTGIEVQALCPGYTHTDFHRDLERQGFSKGQVPQQMWMEAPDVVAASLSALGSGRVLVVPGEGNLELARAGCQRLLDAL